MPIFDKYRINPIDLQPNVAVGVGLPFNGPSVFNSVYNTNEQIKYNIINFLLTNKGERIMNPEFGSDLKRFVFELITDDNIEDIRIIIDDGLKRYIPEAEIINLIVDKNPDQNIITISFSYRSRLNGNQDNITIEFN